MDMRPKFEAAVHALLVRLFTLKLLIPISQLPVTISPGSTVESFALTRYYSTSADRLSDLRGKRSWYISRRSAYTRSPTERAAVRP